MTRFGKFYRFPREIARDITYIPSILERVQRWRVSWILFIYLFIFFQSPNYLIYLNRFSLLAHLFFYITSVSNFQLQLVYTIWIVATFRFFIKSPEEGRLVRPKYRETLSRFSLCCFVIYVYIFVIVVYLIVERAGRSLCEAIF